MSKKEIILKSDFILSFGSMFACDKDSIKSSIIEAINKNSAIFHVKNVLKIGTKKFFIKSLSMLGSPEPGFCNFILILF